MSEAARSPRRAPLTQEQQALVMEALPIIEKAADQSALRWGDVMTRAELRGAGREALVEAAQTFEASQGVPFIKFAAFRVRGAMLDAVRAELRQRGPFIEVGAARTAAAFLAEQPDIAPESHDQGAAPWRQRSAELSSALAAAVVAGMAADVLNSQDGTEEALARREAYGRAIDAIQSVRAQMPEREREVLDLHYGQEVDLHEVAGRLQVAYSTAKRIHASMLDSLAKRLVRLGFTSLIDAGITG